MLTRPSNADTMRELQRGRFTISDSPAETVSLETRFTALKISSVIAWSLLSLYFAYECLITFKFGSLDGIWPLWIILFAEFCLTFQELVLALNLVLCLFTPGKKEPRRSYELRGQSAPSVDVLITCCGESIDIILDTVKAAAAQNYPSNCFRVFVLDDGHDNSLQQAIKQLGSTQLDGRAKVHYLSRTLRPGAKSFFKAGNLQYGIDESYRLGSSEFIAGLDADMIPEAQWLRKMVPHLIMSDTNGIAVNPQFYYNVPPGDPLGQQADFSMFFTVQEVLNDYFDSSMCTGTGYVARRKALEDIGGWPLAESGEDYMCSVLLGDAGWGIAFVRENLQYGLCPESLRALIKQRMRWTDAGIEVHQQFGYYLRQSGFAAKMTLGQRAVNLLYAFRDLAPMTNTLALILLPLALCTPQRLNTTEDLQTQLGRLRTLYLATFFTNKIYSYIAYRHVGMNRVWNFQSNEIWAAPYMTYRCIASFFPISMKIPAFVVCGTIPPNERSRLHRQPLLARFVNVDMLMYLAFVLYASVPFVLRLQRGNVVLLSGPWVKLASCAIKTLVPVHYLIWPPMMPERDKLLEEDNRGVRVPRKECKVYGQGECGKWAVITAVELCVFWWTMQ